MLSIFRKNTIKNFCDFIVMFEMTQEFFRIGAFTFLLLLLFGPGASSLEDLLLDEFAQQVNREHENIL